MQTDSPITSSRPPTLAKAMIIILLVTLAAATIFDMTDGSIAKKADERIPRKATIGGISYDSPNDASDDDWSDIEADEISYSIRSNEVQLSWVDGNSYIGELKQIYTMGSTSAIYSLRPSKSVDGQLWSFSVQLPATFQADHPEGQWAISSTGTSRDAAIWLTLDEHGTATFGRGSSSSDAFESTAERVACERRFTWTRNGSGEILLASADGEAPVRITFSY